MWRFDDYTDGYVVIDIPYGEQQAERAKMLCFDDDDRSVCIYSDDVNEPEKDLIEWAIGYLMERRARLEKDDRDKK